MGGMGMYSCPWARSRTAHGHEYMPMPPHRRVAADESCDRHVSDGTAGVVVVLHPDLLPRLHAPLGFLPLDDLGHGFDDLLVRDALLRPRLFGDGHGDGRRLHAPAR